jgi:CRP/FNR family cyclic AMP-dependent transcriptional regulator
MTDLFDQILLLKKSQLFSEVTTEDLRIVARELEKESCFKGERVFDIGDPSDKMYIIESGRIGISIKVNPREQEFIAELGATECFGEMGMLDDQPRSATAHVIEDTTLCVLDKLKLKALLINYPEVGLGILRSLSLRLREANLRSR